MISVGAGILVREGCVLIGRRRPGLPYSGYWEFPGGKIENGEKPEECVAREFEEELSIQIQVGPLIVRSVFQYEKGPVEIYLFRVYESSGEMQLIEHDKFEWVKPALLKNYELLPGNFSVIGDIVTNLSSEAS